MKEEAITVTKKKKSVGFKILMVVLVIVLLPIVLAGLLLLYVTIADFKYEDPDKVLSESVPMSFSERFSFSEKDMTASIRLNEYDLFYLYKDEVSLEDLKLNDSVYVNAYRLSLKDKAVYLQGKAYGINVPVKIGVDISCDEGKICIHLKKASLGKLCIPIPVKLSMDLKVEPLEFAYMGMLKSVEIKDGCVVGTFPIDTSFISEGLSGWQYLKSAWIYSGENDPMVMLIKDYSENRDKKDYVSDELREYIKLFEKNPEEFQNLLVRMLASGTKEYADKYFSSDLYKKMSTRLIYPGITPEAVEKMRGELPYERNFLFLNSFAKNIDDKFGKYEILKKGIDFVDAKTKKAIDWISFMGDAPEAKEVFPDGTQFCAIYCEGSKTIQKVNNSVYSCGTAVRFPNGNCAVICLMGQNHYIVKIPAQRFDDYYSQKAQEHVAAIEVEEDVFLLVE
jgi:uncharacterized protein YpmS